MPSFVLPSRPSTDQLKRQARELRQSYLDADTAARDRVEPYRSLLPSDAGGLTLTDAKLVLAREYGFESWPKLKHHVAELRGGYDELGRFMDLVRSGEADHAKFIADHGFATSIVRAGLQVDLHVAARFDLLERLISVGGQGRIVPSVRQQGAQVRSGVRIVLDDQDHLLVVGHACLLLGAGDHPRRALHQQRIAVQVSRRRSNACESTGFPSTASGPRIPS